MNDLDALFKEFNNYRLTAPAPTKISGRKLRGVNELPLMSQAIANSIATVAWAISSPKGQKNIQRTIENSVKRKYLPYVNAMASANKKSMHHAYEWGKVGQTSGRLFDLKIPPMSRGKANFSMRLEFRPSKTLVPLTEAQATPGPTGKTVEQRHVFFNKAMVMEYGQKVIIRPTISQYLAFDNPINGRKTLSGLTFTAKPVAIDYSRLPTYHGLQAATESFFAGIGGQEINRDVSNYGTKAARAADRASVMLSVSTPSDGYANAIASRMTEALTPSG
jgi:hypothetical protein